MSIVLREDSLVCPVCDNHVGMHHRNISIFNRGEDELSGLHVEVGLDDVTIDRDISFNPSRRRHGIRIRVGCECGAVSELIIAQHKGVTELRVRVLSGPVDVELTENSSGFQV